MKVLRNFILAIGFAALATACGGSSKEESTAPAPTANEEMAEDMDEMSEDMDEMSEDMDDMADDSADDAANPCGDMGNPCGDDMGGDDL